MPLRAGSQLYRLTGDVKAIRLADAAREDGKVTLPIGTVFRISEDAGPVEEHPHESYYGIEALGGHYRVEQAALDATSAPKGILEKLILTMPLEARGTHSGGISIPAGTEIEITDRYVAVTHGVRCQIVIADGCECPVLLADLHYAREAALAAKLTPKGE